MGSLSISHAPAVILGPAWGHCETWPEAQRHLTLFPRALLKAREGQMARSHQEWCHKSQLRLQHGPPSLVDPCALQQESALLVSKAASQTPMI